MTFRWRADGCWLGCIFTLDNYFTLILTTNDIFILQRAEITCVNIGMSKQLAYLYLLIARANVIYNHSKPVELVDLDICPFNNFCHRNATAVLKEDMVP